MTQTNRVSTGVPELDCMLGGGLIPGTLTVAVGATGIGKTQLGVSFAHSGLAEDGRRGVIVDMASRGDSQNHAEYALRMTGWRPTTADLDALTDTRRVFDPAFEPGDYLRVFQYSSRRISKRDLDWDDWRLWQSELQHKLTGVIAFLYGAFVRGCKRVVIDGVEPVEKASESIQMQLFDYIYHQIVHKDHDWVARDLFRQEFRARSGEVDRHAYHHETLTALLLYTSRETMLEALISKPIEEGDALANANTILLLGKTIEQGRMGRGIYVAKHRGSACDDQIRNYTIGDAGIQIGR